MKYTKDEIIKEIQRVASKLKVDSLTKAIFEQNKTADFSISTIHYHFGSWNEAIKESGLKPIESTEVLSKIKRNLDENELLLDLIRLFKEYKKEPTQSLVNAKGKYSIRPYCKRWNNLTNAFLIAKKKFPSEFEIPLGSTINCNSSKNDTNIENDIIPPTIKPKKLKSRLIFGEPINFRGLRFAPVNEQGVVYLFGMISHELGYMIESIRTEYPDCEGKRCFDKKANQWEHIKIEFEYKSSNFKEHNHNPDGCDVIVCWINDWQDSPVEILELRAVIKYLKN